MWAVMLAMKTMLPPTVVGGWRWGDWDWWCLTKSWAAKKEPRDCVFCVSWIFFFFFSFFFLFLFFMGGDVSYVDFENFGDFAPGLVDKGFVNGDAGCGDEAVDFA